jgi:hypothetical protein
MLSFASSSATKTLARKGKGTPSKAHGHGRPPLVSPAGPVVPGPHPAVRWGSAGRRPARPHADSAGAASRTDKHPPHTVLHQRPPAACPAGPQTRGPGAARAGYKTAAHSLQVPASHSRTVSSCSHTRAPRCSVLSLGLGLRHHTTSVLCSRFVTTKSLTMCGIFAVLGCADCSQAQRARVLTCSRRQAPAVHCTVVLERVFCLCDLDGWKGIISLYREKQTEDISLWADWASVDFTLLRGPCYA